MSGYSPWWRRFLQKYAPFLFKKCPQQNCHWRWDDRCFCGIGCYSSNWHGGVYDFKTKREIEVPPYECPVCGLKVKGDDEFFQHYSSHDLSAEDKAVAEGPGFWHSWWDKADKEGCMNDYYPSVAEMDHSCLYTPKMPAGAVQVRAAERTANGGADGNIFSLPIPEWIDRAVVRGDIGLHLVHESDYWHLKIKTPGGYAVASPGNRLVHGNCSCGREYVRIVALDEWGIPNWNGWCGNCDLFTPGPQKEAG